ncbi:hypothetical protein NMG60_11020527 [Bertholletia excelsa]
MARQFLLNFGIFFHVGVSIFVCILLAESVPTLDPRYDACRPRNCSTGPGIRYPFQIFEYGSEIDFCGYPGFEVYCQNHRPVYTASRSDYFIENIFYHNNSFRMVNLDVLDSECHVPEYRFAFDRSSFKFTPNFADLFLFYNCNSSFPANYTQYPIPCASSPPNHSYAYLDTGSFSLNCEELPCESWVNSPVEVEGVQNNQTVKFMDYEKLLRDGFSLEWVGSISCNDECENSGGRCGFNKTMKRPVCFCPDGAYNTHCNEGKPLQFSIAFFLGFWENFLADDILVHIRIRVNEISERN